MDEQRRGPGDVPTGERMATIGTAAAAATEHKASGEHAIVIGKRTVEEAREVYAENMMGYTMGRPAPYAERLLVPVLRGGTEDPDEGMGMAPMLRQAAGKAKDVITGHAHEPTDR